MSLTCIFFGGLFILAGILFACGKIHPHLQSWQNMHDDEKAAIRIGPLCRNAGFMIALSGVIFLAHGIFPSFDSQHFFIGMFLWLLVTGCDVCFIERSRCYKTH